MGRSVYTYSPHTLNIMDGKALVKDLSERFDANVYYCFIADPKWVNESVVSLRSRGVENPEELDAYIIEEHHRGEGKEPLVLINQKYYYQWLYEQYGEAAGADSEFMKMWTKDPVENNAIIQGFMEDGVYLDLYFADHHVSLSHEIIDYFFYNRSNFLRLIFRDNSFTGGATPERKQYQYLLDGRKTAITLIKKLGGSCAYHICEEGKYDGGFGLGPERDTPWKEMEDILSHGETGKYQLNLCELLTNEEYLKDARNKYFSEKIDFSVFYDDFRELELKDILLIDVE